MVFYMFYVSLYINILKLYLEQISFSYVTGGWLPPISLNNVYKCPYTLLYILIFLMDVFSKQKSSSHLTMAGHWSSTLLELCTYKHCLFETGVGLSSHNRCWAFKFYSTLELKWKQRYREFLLLGLLVASVWYNL